MKYIALNIVPILLCLIAGYMIHFDKPYYGWVIFAAMITYGTHYQCECQCGEDEDDEEGEDDELN